MEGILGGGNRKAESAKGKSRKGGSRKGNVGAASPP
jgi:hypothetical protein